jgi:glycosyltransferase involved in cell wall biosynthesis
MKVLFVNGRPDAGGNPGGDTVQVDKTRTALEAQGVQVDVRSPDALDSLPPCDLAHVFNIQMPECASSVFRALKARNIPIALSPIYWDMFPHWFEEAARGKTVWRQVARVVGRETASRFYIRWQEAKAPRSQTWKLQRALLAEADRVLPNSESEGLLLERLFRPGAAFLSKVDVAPNGIDTGLYESRPEPDAAFVEKYGVRDFVLEVGTVYPVKNQLGLIEALSGLSVPLVFIGPRRADMADYAEACRRKGAERGNVTFIDHLAHDRLPGIYTLAAVHALPSWRETPGLVSLEAAAAGTRVVSTSIGSARDYFGDMARYCHPADPRSIRTAVEKALGSPVPHGLRQLVLDRYTWGSAASATLRCYEKILEARSPSPRPFRAGPN